MRNPWMADIRDFLRDVGLQATRAMHDFALGRYKEAAKALRAIRPVANASAAAMRNAT